MQEPPPSHSFYQHVQELHAGRPVVAGEVVVRRDRQIRVRDAVSPRVDHHVVDALEHHLAHRTQARRELLRGIGLGGSIDQHAGPGLQKLHDQVGSRPVVVQEPPVVVPARPEAAVPVLQMIARPADEAVDVARQIVGAMLVLPDDGKCLVTMSGVLDGDLPRAQLPGHLEHVEPLLGGLHHPAFAATAVVAQPQVGKAAFFPSVPYRRQGIAGLDDAADGVLHNRPPLSVAPARPHLGDAKQEDSRTVAPL